MHQHFTKKIAPRTVPPNAHTAAPIEELAQNETTALERKGATKKISQTENGRDGMHVFSCQIPKEMTRLGICVKKAMISRDLPRSATTTR